MHFSTIPYIPCGKVSWGKREAIIGFWTSLVQKACFLLVELQKETHLGVGEGWWNAIHALTLLTPDTGVRQGCGAVRSWIPALQGLKITKIWPFLSSSAWQERPTRVRDAWIPRQYHLHQLSCLTFYCGRFPWQLGAQNMLFSPDGEILTIFHAWGLTKQTY